jgi:hypothetical protein
MKEEDLKLEVFELTSMFRTDENWGDLRSACVDKDIDVSKAYLLGFFETEDDIECGVIASEESVFQYERDTSQQAVGFSLWQKVSDSKSLLATFPAVEIGLSMIAKGEI